MAVPAANPYLANLAPSAPVIVGFSFLRVELGVVEGISETDSRELSLGVARKFDSGWSASLNGWLSVERMKCDATNQPDAAALGAALSSTEANTAFNPFGRNTATVLDAIRTVQHEAARSKSV